MIGILLSVLVGSVPCLAQKPVFVKQGQETTISGQLSIKSHGWQRFFVLQTQIHYSLDLDPLEDGPITRHEIAFYLSGRTEEVERLAGQSVTVAGPLALNGSSPYYWNGTMLQAHRLESASGLVLLAKQKSPDADAWRDGPKTFVAVIKMLPNKMLPQYSLLSVSSQAGPIQGFSCGVNGGGDLLNCSCPDGYEASRVGKVSNGRFVHTSRVDVLQLDIGEDSTRPVTVAAECTRKE